MKNVLLDMDGVIANFYRSFATYLNKHCGCTLDPTTDPSYYAIEDWGCGIEKVDVEDATIKWILDGGMRNTKTFPGAELFVKRIRSVCEIYVVTARVGDWGQKFSTTINNQIKQDTIDWLEERGIPSDNLHFKHKKIDFCKENDIGIIIEDKLETALDATKNGIKTVLIDREYNRSPVERLNIHRALSYDEAFEKLLKLL